MQIIYVHIFLNMLESNGGDKNMATPAQLKANKKHLEKLDDIKVRVQKGDKDKITAFAKGNGHKSLNAYIVYLIDKDMKAENK